MKQADLRYNESLQGWELYNTENDDEIIDRVSSEDTDIVNACIGTHADDIDWQAVERWANHFDATVGIVLTDY
jgi:hypothetical protein